MQPSVNLYGLVEAKVLHPSDQLCTPAQSAKLAPQIDVGIDCAPVIYFAVVDPATMKASRSDMFSKYPRASSSKVKSSICMCHQLVSSHRRHGSRT